MLFLQRIKRGKLEVFPPKKFIYKACSDVNYFILHDLYYEVLEYHENAALLFFF